MLPGGPKLADLSGRAQNCAVRNGICCAEYRTEKQTAGGCQRGYRDSNTAVFRRGWFWPVIATPWTLFVRPALVTGAAHDNVVTAPASRRAVAQVPGRRFEVDNAHTLLRFFTGFRLVDQFQHPGLRQYSAKNGRRTTASADWFLKRLLRQTLAIPRTFLLECEQIFRRVHS